MGSRQEESEARLGDLWLDLKSPELAGWASWASPVGVGGWRAGAWPGWVTQHHPLPPPALGFPQPRPPRLKKEAIVPASRPCPMGTGPRGRPLAPSPAGQEMRVWPRPQGPGAQARGKECQLGGRQSSLWPSSCPFGKIGVLVVLGPPSSSRQES